MPLCQCRRSREVWIYPSTPPVSDSVLDDPSCSQSRVAIDLERSAEAGYLVGMWSLQPKRTATFVSQRADSRGYSRSRRTGHSRACREIMAHSSPPAVVI